MKHARTIVLAAGIMFISLAIFIQGVLPALLPESRRTDVTRVVRTDLGQLKWISYEASDYTPLELRGRKVYIREGCWYCHSQYVRPVTGETRRWGPVAEAGEYAYDLPHLFSTRRIGPDLTRVGLKYGNGWHFAHHWNPRIVVPESNMPRFPWLFDGPYGPFLIVEDEDGNRTVERTPATEAFFDYSGQDSLFLTPDTAGLAFVPERGRLPIILTPNDEFAGDSVRLLVATQDLRALVAYIQKLGMNRGKWRDVFEPQLLQASQASIPKSEEWIEYGQEVYSRRCVGCHGVKGDGNGAAAKFFAVRPRDFTLGEFKFRLTASGSLPTDGDLLRTITRGVRGTPMPTWHMLPEKDRLAVIQYIEYRLSVDRGDPSDPSDDYYFFEEERPLPPIYVGEPPEPTPQILARGEELWNEVKCWQCHGDEGKGDGESATDLRDDWGFKIRPADLTTGLFKSGPDVQDIFRTMTTGLTGTPMPSFVDQVPDEQDRWALSYYVIALSAYKDPLTGEPLQIPAAGQARLDDPALDASSPGLAYDPFAAAGDRVASRVTNAWAERHGIMLLPIVADSVSAEAGGGSR